MTPLGWTALVITAGVALVALAVALACAARVRDLQVRIAASSAPGHDPFLPAVGTAVPEFAASTVDGEPVGADTLAGPDTPVLFVTTDCESCLELIDRITGLSAPLAGFHRPIAVLIGPASERVGPARRLGAVARVIEDDGVDGLAARFGVRSFPAVVLAGDGVVRAAANELDEIPRPTPA